MTFLKFYPKIEKKKKPESSIDDIQDIPPGPDFSDSESEAPKKPEPVPDPEPPEEPVPDPEPPKEPEVEPEPEPVVKPEPKITLHSDESEQ